MSVAFSPLKAIEDSMIGDAVVYSLERVLREEFRDVVHGKSSVVLGYGKIGRSCATALRGRRSNVAVFDIDPIATLTARLEGYRTGTLAALLADAEIIVGATGRTSLSGEVYAHVGDGAILVSATSRDIEFDLGAIATRRRRQRKALVATYSVRAGQRFYVLNEGRPLNFRDQSILGPYLHLVYAALYYSMQKVVAGDAECGVGELTVEENRYIAERFYRSICEVPRTVERARMQWEASAVRGEECSEWTNRRS